MQTKELFKWIFYFEEKHFTVLLLILSCNKVELLKYGLCSRRWKCVKKQ
jgi:hypothetical protein